MQESTEEAEAAPALLIPTESAVIAIHGPNPNPTWTWTTVHTVRPQRAHSAPTLHKHRANT